MGSTGVQDRSERRGWNNHLSEKERYEQVGRRPDLVVSVCDRARESGHGFDAPRLHWSVPDPVSQNTLTTFRRSFGEITHRVERLLDATRPPIGPIPK